MDSVGLGIPSSIIRFICHIPTGMVGFNGNGIYNRATGLDDIYDAIPRGRVFLHGLELVGKGGLATFGWNFPMFLLSLACPGPVLGFVGMVDWSLATVLILGLVKQASYMPTSRGGCRHTENWRPGTDGRNFFVEAHESGRFESIAHSPKDICTTLIATREVTIVVIFFYVLSGLINVLLCVFTIIACRRTERSWRQPPTRAPAHRSCFWHFPMRDWVSAGRESSKLRHVRTPIRLVLAAMDHTLSTARFGLRYTSKCVAYKLRSQGRLSGCSSRGTANTLALPFKVVAAIARDLDHVDLVSTSRASPQLRGLFFGPDDEAVDDRLQALRKNSCRGSKKSQCQICDGQVCADCSQEKAALAESKAKQHLNNCRPYCSQCYYATFCRSQGTTARKRGGHGRSCQLGRRLAKSKARTDVELASMSFWNRETWTLCRLCADATPAERVHMLEALDGGEAHRLARLPLTCEACKVLLPDAGPRWWVCEFCGCECPSSTHPSWGG